METLSIKKEELQEWMNETFVVYASQSVGRKRAALSVNLERIFRVEADGEIKYEGVDELWAIENFNKWAKLVSQPNT